MHSWWRWHSVHWSRRECHYWRWRWHRLVKMRRLWLKTWRGWLKPAQRSSSQQNRSWIPSRHTANGANLMKGPSLTWAPRGDGARARARTVHGGEEVRTLRKEEGRLRVSVRTLPEGQVFVRTLLSSEEEGLGRNREHVHENARDRIRPEQEVLAHTREGSREGERRTRSLRAQVLWNDPVHSRKYHKGARSVIHVTTVHSRVEAVVTRCSPRRTVWKPVIWSSQRVLGRTHVESMRMVRWRWPAGEREVRWWRTIYVIPFLQVPNQLGQPMYEQILNWVPITCIDYPEG